MSESDRLATDGAVFSNNNVRHGGGNSLSSGIAVNIFCFNVGPTFLYFYLNIAENIHFR